MSGRNHYQAAITCSKLTGTGYGRCVQMEKQGLISPRCPVPDASTADQRSFEALMVHVMANALSERQLGAAFGFASAFPGTNHITLVLHTEMAGRVLWELLPRLDTEYACVRGVPGMRVELRTDRIVLHDLLSHACVHLARSAYPRAMMHNLLPLERPLWTAGNTGLSEAEAAARASWALAETSREIWHKTARDWLLSRMLRRPVLANMTCNRHGWASTYADDREDLAIEWCCEESPAALARRFRNAGVIARPDDPLLGPLRPSRLLPPGGPIQEVRLGHAKVTFRHGDCSRVSPIQGLRISARGEWYR
jgi:hypothetical protein